MRLFHLDKPLLRYVLCFLVFMGLSSQCLADSPHPSDEEIRDHLKEILARPEFSKSQFDIWLSFLQLLADVVGWLGGLRSANPILFWILVIGCSAMLAALIAHIGWTVRRVLFVDSQLRQADGLKEKRELLSRVYREEATRSASAADFTEAIRFLFLSLVYRFDETGRVLFQRAHTNREYLALFDDRPTVRSSLAVFVDTLDQHWYGQRPTAREQYEHCFRLYEGLR
jgi:hypothetical protein